MLDNGVYFRPASWHQSQLQRTFQCQADQQRQWPAFLSARCLIPWLLQPNSRLSPSQYLRRNWKGSDCFFGSHPLRLLPGKTPITMASSASLEPQWLRWWTIGVPSMTGKNIFLTYLFAPQVPANAA